MKKVALITGAGRGIGLGIARCLAEKGFNIVINDIAEAEQANEAVTEIKGFGVEVMYCKADISKPQERADMLKDILNNFGAVHVLVNNAGVAPKVRADITEASEESFERLIKINLQGPYFLTQAIANQMIKQRKENKDDFMCIVNISSVSAQTASPSRGEYCISKAGISMATKLWAVRLAEENIMVYEIQPGIIKTDMTEAVTEKYDKLISEGLVPQKRWGLPEDIGKAAAALCEGNLIYSTGQVLMLDGGQLIHRL